MTPRRSRRAGRPAPGGLPTTPGWSWGRPAARECPHLHGPAGRRGDRCATGQQHPHRGPARLSALIGLIRSHQETLPRGAGPVRAITVSTTGLVDGAGTIINSVAVRDWSGFPLGRMLSERLGLPVRVENDINASAYGEFAARCGDGVLSNDADLLFVALSRGVLSGLVLRGQLHRGRGFTAGEVGIVVTGGSGPSEAIWRVPPK
ncbi:MAG: ROK family protein [Tessaracoccus sp.]